MGCEQALEAISAALDGELSPAERAELEAHLSGCPDCRALAEDLRVLTAALDRTEAAPPPGLAAGVMERVAAVTPISAGRRKSDRRWLGLAAMLALVICAGGIGLWLRGADLTAEMNEYSGGGAPAALAPAAPVPSGAQEDLDRSYSYANGFSEPENGEPAPCDVEGSIVKDGIIGNNGREGQDELGLDGADPGAAPGAAPAPTSLEPGEPMGYAFSNVQAVRVAKDMAAEVPMARVLGSVEAVQDFEEDFPDSGLTEQLAAYDMEYFVANRLLAVVVTQETGAVCDIENVSYYFDSESAHTEPVTKKVEIVRTVPEVGTDGTAVWVLLAEVDAMFEDGEVLEVVFSD